MEAVAEITAAVKNVPALRFPEFEGEWKEKKGTDLFNSSRTKGNDTLPIYSVTLDRGLVPRDSLERTMGNDAKATDNLYVAENDITYNMMRMWQGAYGLAKIDCMVSPAYVVLRPKNNVCPEFFISLFSRSRSLYLFTAFSYGLTSDRLRLYYKDFAQIKFVIPELPEQQKIASFLTTVDDKIQQLNKKKALLEKYKKGVMQQIFSQQIRFKDKNGNDFPEWEEKRLKDVAEKKASTISANKIEENIGEYIIYGASGFLKKVDFYQVENDYISIVKDGAGVGRLLYCEGKSSVLGTLDIIKPKLGIDTYFMYCLLSRIDFTKYTTGSTIPHIYFKDYSLEKIALPAIEEQGKIANFLSSIDNKISYTSKQLKKAHQFKKGLLQQLFV